VHRCQEYLHAQALAEAGLPDISENLVGQTAFVMGDSEVFAAAKALKNFEKEFKKPEMKIGLLGTTVLDTAKLQAIADIPSARPCCHNCSALSSSRHPASPASSRRNTTRTKKPLPQRPNKQSEWMATSLSGCRLNPQWFLVERQPPP